MNDELKNFIEIDQAKHNEKLFFIEQGLGAEVHWFFIQAFDALKAELYLPACTSFINGIEASLRITVAQIQDQTRIKELDPAKMLSNRLLSDAKVAGLPVEALVFPGEQDFLIKLKKKRKKPLNVEIVRVRHNLCHGNILEYVNDKLGEQDVFFTPECCRELASILHAVSKAWAEGLGAFRRDFFHGKSAGQ
jgi:hypothetical protein